ncbi:hypothetical protein CCH79_00011181 [Gambusia affinis]|uniref:Sec1 family domain-containing protein 2 n=1 Tax=Gambusia affinis TaxID=33528 RepID=A0A315UU95_GAMAF|nr:hypothetical protein CCH79_00011181 [Gambusia affinis]
MLTAEDFTQLPLLMWEKVFAKVKKAVVFMDDRSAEALHWSGGAGALLQAGARNVKQFSSFEACGENEPKAVFVVSTLLKGRTVDIIKDIISLSHFQYCVVFTAVPHSVHLFANNVSTEMDGFPVFEQFEEKLCEWMGNMNYTAEVMHSPVVFAPVSQQLIVASPFAHLFPLLPADLASINAKRPEKKRFGTLSDLDGHSLPVELQIEIKSLVSALNSMFEAAGMREESFAVGPMSRIIAGELANHNQAKNRRKTAPSKASIIFIDRTMDLTGAVGHHGDNLVEKMLTVLDPLPGHVTDVQVDMLELTSVQRTPHSQNTVAPGCLAQTQWASRALSQMLQTLKCCRGRTRKNTSVPARFKCTLSAPLATGTVYVDRSSMAKPTLCICTSLESRTFELHWQRAQSFPQSPSEPRRPVICPSWTLMSRLESVQCGQSRAWVAEVL